MNGRPGGQWYARKIVNESSHAGRGLSRRITVIRVDTTRDIPDEILDPGSGDSPGIFRPSGVASLPG